MVTGPHGIPPDPHGVLGVQPGADADEVARAYRRLLRRLHPDTSPDADPDVDLDAVRAAYALLRDGGRTTPQAARTVDTEPPITGLRRRPRAYASPSTEWLWVGPVIWEPPDPDGDQPRA